MAELNITRSYKIISSTLITFNIFIPALALFFQRLTPIFHFPLLNNVIGILSVVLVMGNYLFVFIMFRKYQFHARLRFFLKLFFLITPFVYFLEYGINFAGYSEIPIGTDNLLMSLGFLYFIPFIYGASIIFTINYWLNPNVRQSREIRIERRTNQDLKKSNKIWLIISTILISGILLVGILMDYTYFFARVSGLFMLGVFAAMSSLMLAIVFFIKTIQILSNFEQLFTKSKKKTNAIIITAILGFSISAISFIPVLGTPFYIVDAEREFDVAFDPEFGGDWEAQISDSAMRYFKKNHFQLLDYFMGPIDYPCVEIKDVLYFNGSVSSFSVDESIELYFDAYLPPEGHIGMPGENSTIIRIHGGGWVIGDKGTGNIAPMNRYFASQGYVVFDIQYGLNNESDLFSNLPYEPENVMGNFTMDDILRHIGNFTHYLETHTSEYGANLDSVFISGGSAGGQLTCATALILAGKNYTEFSDAFTIKGMVPFYPANNASLDFMSTSRPEWVDPVLMLNDSSPPCLIFQGNQDPLIVQSQRLKNTYLGFGRTDCAHIQFPFAGHGNDVYFPGFYNQIFLYYMERFLYLYH